MTEAHAESHLPTYKRIIVTLAVLTAVEFGIAFLMHGASPGLHAAGVVTLIGLAAWKAVLVARFFMHLKYDPSVLAFLVVLPIFLGAPIVFLVGFDLIKGPNL